MEDLKKLLAADTDGMATYEYIANNVDSILEMLPMLISNLERVDKSGQFLCSTARFLAAVDRERFKQSIGQLIASAIDKDKERKYLSSMLSAIWGKDYMEHAEELKATDDNFRRVYKRVYDNNLI